MSIHTHQIRFCILIKMFFYYAIWSLAKKKRINKCNKTVWLLENNFLFCRSTCFRFLYLKNNYLFECEKSKGRTMLIRIKFNKVLWKKNPTALRWVKYAEHVIFNEFCFQRKRNIALKFCENASFVTIFKPNLPLWRHIDFCRPKRSTENITSVIMNGII